MILDSKKRLQSINNQLQCNIHKSESTECIANQFRITKDVKPYSEYLISVQFQKKNQLHLLITSIW